MPRVTPRGPVPPKSTIVWVVVADAARARLFVTHRHDGALEEVGDLLNADARLLPQEAQADRAGRVTQGRRGASHSFESRESYEEHTATVFAKRIGRQLCDARRKGALQRLYLLADPPFLGRLREALDAPTRALVVDGQPVDLVRRNAAEIRKALPARL